MDQKLVMEKIGAHVILPLKNKLSKNPLFYTSVVLFIHKSSLEKKLEALYPLYSYLQSQYPFDAWVLRSQILKNPLGHFNFFQGVPCLSLDKIIEIDRTVFERAEDDKKYIRLEENSEAYQVLEYCLKTESSINLLNFILRFLNIGLLFSLLA